jgi:hypothetical protein
MRKLGSVWDAVPKKSGRADYALCGDESRRRETDRGVYDNPKTRGHILTGRGAKDSMRRLS